mgnify:CR=1 FL=1
MNKILKVLALGAMALSTTACSDFLEVNPRTQVSETEFYKTEDDMMKGLYAVMNEMQTRMPEVWSYSSLLGDESETGGGIGEGSLQDEIGILLPMTRLLVSVHGDMVLGGMSGILACSMESLLPIC